jgi:hypothetical protein
MLGILRFISDTVYDCIEAIRKTPPIYFQNIMGSASGFYISNVRAFKYSNLVIELEDRDIRDNSSRWILGSAFDLSTWDLSQITSLEGMFNSVGSEGADVANMLSKVPTIGTSPTATTTTADPMGLWGDTTSALATQSNAFFSAGGTDMTTATYGLQGTLTDGAGTVESSSICKMPSLTDQTIPSDWRLVEPKPKGIFSRIRSFFDLSWEENK